MKRDRIDLAGDRMTLEQRAEGEKVTTTITFDDKGTGRVCGSCQLCCKLVPVQEIHKAAGERCSYSKVGKGCTIYARRPFDCRAWSCRWLVHHETAGMPRPDRCHYVIDMMLDHVRYTEEGEEPATFDVIQVWVDPAFPDAHRAPELRAYLNQMAAKFGLCAIIRFDSERAIVLFPPAMTSQGKWVEVSSNLIATIARNELEQKVLEDFNRRRNDG